MMDFQLGSPAAAVDRPEDALRQKADDTYNRIRSSGLNTDAQLALLAEAYVGVRDGMAKLQAQTGEVDGATLAMLKRSVFGIDGVLGAAPPSSQASSQIAFRDAQDRVQAALNAGQQLLPLLEVADISGDETMAQAVFNAATSNFLSPDEDVVTTFLATRPAKQQAYDQLLAAQRPTNAADLFRWVVPTPPELNRVPSGQTVDSLAAQAAQVRTAASATTSI